MQILLIHPSPPFDDPPDRLVVVAGWLHEEFELGWLGGHLNLRLAHHCLVQQRVDFRLEDGHEVFGVDELCIKLFHAAKL